MKSVFRNSGILFAMIALFSLSAAFAADTTLTVGKKGEVIFDQPTQVGDVTLPPGTYTFQHRVVGNDHFVKFVGAKMMEHSNLPGRAGMPSEMPMGPTTTKEIKCSVEPLKQKAKQTAVTIDNSSGQAKVTRIEVAGESVAHVF
jgi:hypothetical protein